MSNYKLSIIGLGFVGNAMYQSFKKKNLNPIGYDKFKNGGIGSINECLDSDICFFALPTEYSYRSGEYDKTAIKENLKILQKNNYQGLIVLKSTVEPETTKNLSHEFNKLKLIHNPEFLTARTAEDNFHNQSHIIIGKGPNCTDKDIQLLQNFYKINYSNANISICSSTESESMKIFVNSFYAVKVQFFNELYLLCQKNGSNYNKVKDLMLKNDWINPMHTTVPGPDGKLSYGGACFPKDTNALLKYMEKYNSDNKVLESCIEERNTMRDDNVNCK